MKSHSLPAYILVLICLCCTSIGALGQTPGINCDGIYLRETEDRDWHVRIIGKVTSPAGCCIAITNLEGTVIFRGTVPRGLYPPETPYQVKVPRDGIAGDYLLTIFGTQADFGGIRTPYTDLPFEVYGKEVNGRTFLQVIPHNSAHPQTALVPGSLYFQVFAGSEELTITQSDSAWQLHALDGSVVFDVRTDGKSEINPRNRKTIWSGTFKGTPGTFYRLGHSLYWFYASPRLYVAVSPERWFVPDPRLRLDPAWWRQVDAMPKQGIDTP